MGFIRFTINRIIEITTIVVLILVMPYIPPNVEFSKSYIVKPSLPLEGSLMVNERLNNVEKWHEHELWGPEAFAEYKGEIYTGLNGGDVVKLVGNHITPIVKFGKPCKGNYEEKKCGRPLGMIFDKNGFLYVADAYYGIFKVDVKTGEKTQLVSVDKEINGKKPKIPNSIAVSSTGDLYWSDSSTDFLLEDGIFDLLADGSGRLIHYNPRTQTNTVLIENIHFANGVRISEDESYVLVAETANSRILRYYLKGPNKGKHDVFIDGLPGCPDNINSDGQGGYLIPLVVSRDNNFPIIFQLLYPFPTMRKLVSRLMGIPEVFFKFTDDIYPNQYTQRMIHAIGHFNIGYLSLILYPKRTTILRVSSDGKIIESLHSTKGDIRSVSEAFIYKDNLLLGSPFNNYIGRISLKNAGLGHLNNKTPPPTVKSNTQRSETLKTDKKYSTPSTTVQTSTTTKHSTTTSSPPTVKTSSSTVTTPSPSTVTSSSASSKPSDNPRTSGTKSTSTARPKTTTTASPTTSTQPPIKTSTQKSTQQHRTSSKKETKTNSQSSRVPTDEL